TDHFTKTLSHLFLCIGPADTNPFTGVPWIKFQILRAIISSCVPSLPSVGIFTCIGRAHRHPRSVSDLTPFTELFFSIDTTYLEGIYGAGCEWRLSQIGNRIVRRSQGSGNKLEESSPITVRTKAIRGNVGARVSARPKFVSSK